jgi:hypothetical protein
MKARQARKIIYLHRQNRLIVNHHRDAFQLAQDREINEQ